MTNRATRLAPRIAIATILASAALATVQLRPAAAVDECVAKPTTSPAGKHWFYRIDRATKRQCWYLRDSDIPEGASLEVRKSAAARSQTAPAALLLSTADAHAELPRPSMSGDDGVTSGPAAAAPAASPAATTSAAPSATVGAAAQWLPESGAGVVDQSAITARWPDQIDAPVRDAAPSRASSVAAASTAPGSSSAIETITPATAAQLPVGEAEGQPASTLMGAADPARMKLFIFLGTFVLVGVASSVLLARARGRRRIRFAPAAVARRATRWPAEPEIDRMRLPTVDTYHPALVSGYDAGSRGAVRPSIVPRDEEPGDEQFEVEQMLARYAGQSQRRR